jgi:adenylate kinase
MGEMYPEIKKIMDSGQLVPDKEFTSYLTAYLDSENMYDGIIFDGFPRTLDQYNFLKIWLEQKQVKMDLVFVIEISEDETVRRLGGRKLDPKTGKIYNLITEKLPEGVDKNSLVQRDDDKEEAIKKRLEIYNTKTVELVSEISKKSKVVKINGERSVEEIHSEISSIIDQLQK